VHARIEEKFKDFRKAFRSFDKNFDGGLNFKEFITGMDGIGIKLKLTDYRLIFDAIDYD
jgi:Ca2+-binding EF-hand superfamily protein